MAAWPWIRSGQRSAVCHPRTHDRRCNRMRSSRLHHLVRRDEPLTTLVRLVPGDQNYLVWHPFRCQIQAAELLACIVPVTATHALPTRKGRLPDEGFRSRSASTHGCCFSTGRDRGPGPIVDTFGSQPKCRRIHHRSREFHRCWGCGTRHLARSPKIRSKAQNCWGQVAFQGYCAPQRIESPQRGALLALHLWTNEPSNLTG